MKPWLYMNTNMNFNCSLIIKHYVDMHRENIDFIFIYNGILHICYKSQVITNLKTGLYTYVSSVIYMHGPRELMYNVAYDKAVSINEIKHAQIIKIPNNPLLRSYIIRHMTIPLI